MSSYPVFGTSTGWHSIFKKVRKSQIEDLGEGTNLYFKFLKYFMFLFICCGIISIPQILINNRGVEYSDVTNFVKSYFGAASIGNIGPYQEVNCKSSLIPPSMNDATYIPLTCSKGKSLRAILHIGLAFQEETCGGSGFNKTIKTVDRCTLGSMTSAQQEFDIEESFK